MKIEHHKSSYKNSSQHISSNNNRNYLQEQRDMRVSKEHKTIKKLAR
jgi:hypothetical protein